MSKHKSKNKNKHKSKSKSKITKDRKKQLELSKWLKQGGRGASQSCDPEPRNPKLAFGYGYDPKVLKNGIKHVSFSHELEDGLRLYEFTPKISYRIFNELAKVLNYKCAGNELRKGTTTIKNNYFTTDQDPKTIVKKLNKAIKRLFELYDPLPKYDI